jgi:hypothetical protein
MPAMIRPLSALSNAQSRLQRSGTLSPSDALCAFITGIVALALFVATLQPGFGGPEDTPKFQFLGYALGTAHPPGYPLYSLLSHVFVQLPIGTIAYRANLFSAVTAALACALVCVIAIQIGARRWAACSAALAMAAGASFWLSAVYAEVYGLAAMMAALTMTLLLGWAARGGTTRLLLAVAAFGLGLGNHLTLVGILPAGLIFIVLRDRRVLSPRIVAAAAGVLLLTLSQYGFIILRTHQGAPYLESGAQSISDLVSVITAQRFAEKRFAFGPSVLLTDHLPALVRLIGHELGPAGVLMLIAGGVAAIRRRDGGAAVLAGAGVGMFAIALNIAGDLKGFITPVMVFAWPFTALGITALAQWLVAFGLDRRSVGVVGVLLSVAMPLSNVTSNFKEADQSGNHEPALFHVALFTQLPARAGLVVEDYASDMALYYYKLTGEAGPRQDLVRVPWDPVQVRAAAREHRVYAYARAAAVLQAQGLAFERWNVAGPSFDEWVGALPPGSLIAGATAYVAAPLDLSRIGHATLRPAVRPRAFDAFAFVSRRRGASWHEGDDEAALTVEPREIGATLPALLSPLIASADRGGARVTAGGQTIAQVDTGGAFGVFAPDGPLLRTLELSTGDPLRVPFQELIYELKGETPCVNLSTENWTDLTEALSTGSWVTTFSEVGSLAVETVFQDSPVTAIGRELLGGGAVRTTGPVSNSDGSATLVTELTRTGGRRPLFRVAFDRPRSAARARVKAGGSRASVTLCADRPMNPLFGGGDNVAVIRPDFESESYFGAGWSGVERGATGRVRYGSSGATLLLPLDAAYTHRLTLDLAAADSTTIDVNADDVVIGTCAVRDRVPCDVEVPPDARRAPVTALTLSVRGPAHESARLTFQRARIARVSKP